MSRPRIKLSGDGIACFLEGCYFLFLNTDKMALYSDDTQCDGEGRVIGAFNSRQSALLCRSSPQPYIHDSTSISLMFLCFSTSAPSSIRCAAMLIDSISIWKFVGHALESIYYPSSLPFESTGYRLQLTVSFRLCLFLFISSSRYSK
jgi:hypothetical protein